MSNTSKAGAKTVWEDVWISSICTMCYGGCPIRVHRVNGVAVDITGEPDCPATQGRLCAKGQAALQILYDPNRLNYPMKRTNPEKGLGIDPKWQRISWDEALDLMAERFRDAYKRNPDGLLHQYIPGQGPLAVFMHSFARAFGGDVNSGGGGLYCGNATHFMSALVHGAWSYTADFQRCNYAIYFGSSKGHGAGHTSVHMMNLAADAKSRGMKMVAFDPVCNFTGGRATEWIPIVPGTDGAVALAMLNVILNELGNYDVEYLKNTSNGPFLIGADRRYLRDKQTGKPLVFDARAGKAKAFDDPSIGDYALEGSYKIDGVECEPAFQLLKEHVKKYTVEVASEISTVPSSVIRRIAMEFSQAANIGSTVTVQGKSLPLRPAAAILFRGVNGHKNGLNTIAAIYLLNAVVGANNVPGGAIGWPSQFFGLPGTNYPQFMNSVDKDGSLISGWWFPTGHRLFPLHEPKFPPKKQTLKDLFPWLTTSPFVDASDREEIRKKANLTNQREILMNWGTNTIMSLPNKDEVARSLKEYPLVVSWRLFLDEFSDFCDIVLPDTCFLETLFVTDHMEVGFTGATGMTDWYYGIKQPVVKPPFERRQAFEVYLELAKRVGPELLTALYKDINVALRLREPYVLQLDPTKNYTWKDICDRAVKSYMGDDYGLEWFKDHHGITFPKKVEETYFRPFVKNLRQPIYYEFMLEMGEQARRICEQTGIKIDIEQYTPLPDYFPCHEGKAEEYDLYAITYRDTAHSGSTTFEVPWLDEVSQLNPYTYNIQMANETAKKRGIKDGDTIWVESDIGRKVKGTVKLMQGIHPQVIGFSACSGHFSRNLPIAFGKGSHFNDLLQMDLKHLDPVSMSIEASAKVKVYKAKDGGVQ